MRHWSQDLGSGIQDLGVRTCWGRSRFAVTEMRTVLTDVKRLDDAADEEGVGTRTTSVWKRKQGTAEKQSPVKFVIRITVIQTAHASDCWSSLLRNSVPLKSVLVPTTTAVDAPFSLHSLHRQLQQCRHSFRLHSRCQLHTHRCRHHRCMDRNRSEPCGRRREVRSESCKQAPDEERISFASLCVSHTPDGRLCKALCEYRSVMSLCRSCTGPVSCSTVKPSCRLCTELGE